MEPVACDWPTEKSFACIWVHAEKQPTVAIVVDEVHANQGDRGQQIKSSLLSCNTAAPSACALCPDCTLSKWDHWYSDTWCLLTHAPIFLSMIWASTRPQATSLSVYACQQGGILGSRCSCTQCKPQIRPNKLILRQYNTGNRVELSAATIVIRT